MARVKTKPLATVRYCYTEVREFKAPYTLEMAKAFIDDLKAFGASQEHLEKILTNKTVTWEQEDECERTWHAVEVID